MSESEILKIFPNTQIKPYDGMSVTADVWAKAHAEHRQARRAHDLIFHGSGIVTGLEVIANDPPNQLVFISPGVAVDPAGTVIVLSEPVAYDFGNTSEGTLFLVLGHGEREVGGVEKEVILIQDEFVIAARPTMPKRPVVELARVVISKSGNPVMNAADPEHPGIEELDLRFRDNLSLQTKQRVKVAVCELGSEVPSVLIGWDYLGRECARSTSYALIVDQLPVSGEISGYDLVYLSGKGAFKMETDQLKILHSLLDGGRTLIAESLDAAAERSFRSVFETLDVKLSPMDASHPILTVPFLFTAPPPGALGNQVQVNGRVIFSTAGYSLAWGGASSSGQASRADIRSAHEWGINFLHYCIRQTRIG
jgi:hypothetical protein